jgi:hypothetical protein
MLATTPESRWRSRSASCVVVLQIFATSLELPQHLTCVVYAWPALLSRLLQCVGWLIGRWWYLKRETQLIRKSWLYAQAIIQGPRTAQYIPLTACLYNNTHLWHLQAVAIFVTDVFCLLNAATAWAILTHACSRMRADVVRVKYCLWTNPLHRLWMIVVAPTLRMCWSCFTLLVANMHLMTVWQMTISDIHIERGQVHLVSTNNDRRLSN